MNINLSAILKHKTKLALSLGVIGLVLIYRNRSKPNPYLSTYQRLRNEIQLKVIEVQEEIASCQLQQREKAIIKHSSIPSLKEFMFKKKYTCLEIVLTFIDVAIQEGFYKGYLCDVSFKEAIQQAKECDQLIDQDPNVVNSKPLFGIPVSMKDTFISPNTYQTFCVASKAQNRSLEHGIQSFLITQAGGIIFAKTTLPQFGFSYESLSHLFGRAVHPTDIDRSAGGSSGGEGGLIAIGASPLGLGSDSGGSIRIPSHFCGLYGYKPSAKRLCMRGQAKGIGSWDGIRNIASCYGPMAKHFDNLVCMMEALTQNLEQAPVQIRDINFFMKDFNTTECYNDQKKMKIGVLRSMDMMLPCQSVVRALNETVERLRNLGHEVVEFEIPQNIYTQIYQIAYYVMLGDGGMKSTYELYKGEPLINHFDNFVKSSQSCPLFKKIYQFILKRQGRLRELMRWKAGDHGLSYYEMLNHTASLASLQVQMAQIWDNMQLDALISPVTAGVAVKHDTAMNCFSAICYTFVWNMLDFSAGSVPITKVKNNEQFYNELSLFGKKDIEYKVMVDQLRYSENLPVGIQVISRPFQDEICLNLMRQCAPEQN